MADDGFTDTLGLGLWGAEGLEFLEGEETAMEFEGEVSGVEVF